MADEILKVDHVSIGFSEKRRMPWEKAKRTEVLKDVSFSMKKGEVLALAGESGCGKSTLAKVILGLQKPDAGTVQHFGNRPQMVFQDPYSSLNPAKRIGWILEEPLKNMGGIPAKERRRQALDMLKRVGLDEKLIDRYPDQLSGGQRQRVCIGACLLYTSAGKSPIPKGSGICPETARSPARKTDRSGLPTASCQGSPAAAARRCPDSSSRLPPAPRC